MHFSQDRVVHLHHSGAPKSITVLLQVIQDYVLVVVSFFLYTEGFLPQIYSVGKQNVENVWRPGAASLMTLW